MRPDLWNMLEPVGVNPRVKSWKDILRNLIFHANEHGEAWPSIETIRSEVGYKSRKAVIDALAGLEHSGLIRRSRNGKGRATRLTYKLIFDDRTINILSSDVYNTTNGEVGLPMLLTNGEVTSNNNGEVGLSATKNGEVTSKNGEVTSKNGEVTSHRIKNEISNNPSPTSIAANGEVTSPNVDNSAEGVLTPQGPGNTEVAPSARKEAPARTGVMALLDKNDEVDYLSLCDKPGWRPNDPRQTPPADFKEAQRAVIACAYRAKLSPEMAKKFWHYNAIRRWTAIDCGCTVSELAHAFCRRWFNDAPEEYWKEQNRRKQAASKRIIT